MDSNRWVDGTTWSNFDRNSIYIGSLWETFLSTATVFSNIEIVVLKWEVMEVTLIELSSWTVRLVIGGMVATWTDESVAVTYWNSFG